MTGLHDACRVRCEEAYGRPLAKRLRRDQGRQGTHRPPDEDACRSRSAWNDDDRFRLMAMQLPDLAAHDTLPKLLRLNAERWPGDVAAREKDLGIWKRYDWADMSARGAGAGIGADGAGRRPRRCGRHYRAQPAALGLGGARSAQRRRDVARDLRGQPRQGGQLSPRLWRGQMRVRRGRGAGGQAPGDCGRPAGAAVDRLQ